MPRRSEYEEDYDYEDEDFEDNKGPRRFRKDETVPEKKKKWTRETAYERDHDYDERR